MHLDAPGSFRKAREHRRNGLRCPSLLKCMLLRIFDHFSVIFFVISDSFHAFSCVLTHLEAQGIWEGWLEMAIPHKMYVTTIFLFIFRSFFAILDHCHVFE